MAEKKERKKVKSKRPPPDKAGGRAELRSRAADIRQRYVDPFIPSSLDPSDSTSSGRFGEGAPLGAEDFSTHMAGTRGRANRLRRKRTEIDPERAEDRRSEMSGLRGGGKVEMSYKKGGSVKAKSIDGIAQRGRTRGTMR